MSLPLEAPPLTPYKCSVKINPACMTEVSVYSTSRKWIDFLFRALSKLGLSTEIRA